jgi:hypothetical protein
MSQAQLTQTTIVVSTSSHYSKRSMLSNFSRRHPRLHQVPESIVEQAPQEEGTILETRMANAHSYECGRSNPLLDLDGTGYWVVCICGGGQVRLRSYTSRSSGKQKMVACPSRNVSTAGTLDIWHLRIPCIEQWRCTVSLA